MYCYCCDNTGEGLSRFLKHHLKLISEFFKAPDPTPSVSWTPIWDTHGPIQTPQMYSLVPLSSRPHVCRQHQMGQPLYCEASSLGYPKGKVPGGPDAPPAVKSPIPCPWITAQPLTRLCPHSLHQKTHLLKPPTPKPALLSEFREDHFILPEPQVADNSGMYSVTDKPIPSTPAPASPLSPQGTTLTSFLVSSLYT